MSNVRLNVPPRLIESARAAQYANRENLGSRELKKKINKRAKIKAVQERKKNPLAQQEREGGQLEFQRTPLQRIWTRRRRRGVYVLFISIIDENDSRTPADWDRFKSIDEIDLKPELIETYKLTNFSEPVFGLSTLTGMLTVEDYKFVVLYPFRPGLELGLPAHWPLKNGKPFAYLMEVGRGSVFSDYFQIINQFAALHQFDFIHVSVDNSGSMDTDTVRTSLTDFVNRLRNEGIPYLVTYMEPPEEYIKAHLFLIPEP